MQLYGGQTLWPTGISEIRQKQQLYGGGHFMAKKHVTLWRTNFMANRNFRNSAKHQLYGGGHFMVNPHNAKHQLYGKRSLYGEPRI